MAITAAPIAEALAHHGAKTPVGSVLRSRQWAAMPLALRQRAQASAGVESARYVQRIQDGIQGVLSREEGWDRSRVIRDLMQIAEREGLRPTGDDRGGLLDPGSERRTELIYAMQTGQAYGHAEWRTGQDPDALDAAPAWELVRWEDRQVPRDWTKRWLDAGGRLYGGRMIALKTDPVWERISRFGVPWPPFDFGSGMGVDDVLRPEAEALGVLPPDAPAPEPVEADFNARLEASANGLGPELRQNLVSLFGPQVNIDGDTIRWNSQQAAAYESDRTNIRALARSVFERSQGILGGLGRGVSVSEVEGGLAADVSREAAVQISAVAVGRKPLYHEDWGWLDPEQVAQAAAELQRALPPGVRVINRGSHLYAWHPVLTQFADESRQLLPQVIAQSDNGRWLGYGVNFLVEDAPTVAVRIQNAAGASVAGFRAPRQFADLYATARARDWTDATGQPHAYQILQ